MTSPTTAVIEFPTPDPVEDCLSRGVFAWDCGNEGSHVLRAEKFGKNLLFFHSKHMILMICTIPHKHTSQGNL